MRTPHTFFKAQVGPTVEAVANPIQEEFITEALSKLVSEFIPLINTKQTFADLSPNQRKSLNQIIETTYDRMHRGTRAMAKINWSRVVGKSEKSQKHLKFTTKYQSLDQLTNVIIQAFNNLVLLALESGSLDQANTKSNSIIDEFKQGLDRLNNTEKFPKLTLPLILVSNFWSLYPITTNFANQFQIFDTKEGKLKNLKFDNEDLKQLRESFVSLPTKFNFLKEDLSIVVPALQLVIAAFHNRLALDEQEYDFDLENHLDNLEHLLKLFQGDLAEDHSEIISEALTQWYATFAHQAKEIDHESFSRPQEIIEKNKEVFLKAIQVTEQRHRENDLSFIKRECNFPGVVMYLMPKSVAFENLLLRPHMFNKDFSVKRTACLFGESFFDDITDFDRVKTEFEELKKSFLDL